MSTTPPPSGPLLQRPLSGEVEPLLGDGYDVSPISDRGIAASRGLVLRIATAMFAFLVMGMIQSTTGVGCAVSFYERTLSC